MSGAGDKLFKKAHSRHVAGDLAEARNLYQKILRKTPRHVDALYMLGTLLAEQGELDQALRYLSQASSLAPQSPMIHNNLANVYLKSGKLDQALASYQRVIQQSPNLPEPRFNLGYILLKQGKLEQAIASLEQAVSLKPDFYLAQLYLGNAYKTAANYPRAVLCYQQALKHTADPKDALFGLGNALAAQKNYPEAVACFKQILALEPDNASVQHAIAALQGETPEAAPADHVKGIFDQLATDFDNHLTQLGYQIPAQLKDRLVQVAGEDKRFERGVDLGCGTGMSGIAFKPLVSRLDGVDLSGEMVKLAAQKGVYAQLDEGEIVTYLEQSPQHYDLFIATDVLVYLGNLAPLFQAIRRKAAPDAYLVFSTESADEGGYLLQPTGRYACSRAYIQRLADEYGFTVALVEQTMIRREQDQPIMGDMFILKAG